MALRTTISNINRVIDRDGEWDINIKQIGYGIQWKCHAKYTAEYRYIGMTEDAALAWVETITAAYTHMRTLQTARWVSHNPQKLWTITNYAELERQEATVSASPMGLGRMWQVSVSVDAERDWFTVSANAPTEDQVKAQLSGVDNYPEISYVPQEAT